MSDEITERGAPSVHRMFQYNKLGTNSNKYWEIKWWEEDSHCIVKYGRVGAEAIEESSRTRKYVEDKIREKVKKGYKPVDLHTVKPIQVVNGSTAKVMGQKEHWLMSSIIGAANNSIKSYLAIPVDALSMGQIMSGRRILQRIQTAVGSDVHQTVIDNLVEDYFNTIPTQLPARIDKAVVVDRFVRHLADQEVRLQQLEAAIKNIKAPVVTQFDTVTSEYMQLGVKLEYMTVTDPLHQEWSDYIVKTGNNIVSVVELFKVEIPEERKAYGKCDVDNVHTLFHGTHTDNVRHIFGGGLIIPKIAANGRRFGDGIYFADHSARSMSYTRGNLRVMFIADVKLGNPLILNGVDGDLKNAPEGHHSVWGQNSYSGMDEFIVYQPPQQTIKGLAVVR